MKLKSTLSLYFFCFTLGAAAAQKPAETSNLNLKAVQQGMALLDQGRCGEALPLLRKFAALGPGNRDIKLKAGLATVRCAMTMDRVDIGVDAIRVLNRDFPTDPDVLYTTVHAYSDLSTRASLALVRVAPLSHQARQLNAESLEAQGKWDEAASEYRAILKQDPKIAGIHFRIGRCILSREETATTAAEARKEFEAELGIDPNNAGAEYILGNLAQHTGDLTGAIEHFGRAAKLSPEFAEAQLGLGMALMATSKFDEAVAPLEKYTRIAPGNPAGHYQLMMAYSRTGRKQDAAREGALQEQAAQKLEQEKQRNQGVRPSDPPTP